MTTTPDDGIPQYCSFIGHLSDNKTGTYGPHLYETFVPADELREAVAGNLVTRKGHTVWRKTPPRDTGPARTYHIMMPHRRPGGEYLSVGSLLMLNHDIGPDAYRRWEHTFDILQHFIRTKPQ